MKVDIKNIPSYVALEIQEFLKISAQDEAIATRLKKAKTILIKPNLLGAFPPEKAVTVHPVVIESLIIFLKELGKEVWLGDSPGGSIKFSEVIATCGLSEIIKKHDVRLIDFGKQGLSAYKVDGVQYHLEKDFFAADAVINVAKYKTHGLMQFTGCIKNLYGLIPGLEKAMLHKEFPRPAQFSKLICDVYKNAKPQIIWHIMDGIIGMDGKGPSGGNPQPFGLMFSSTSASALDYIASKFMGFKNIPYITQSLLDDKIAPADIYVQDKWQNYHIANCDIAAVNNSRQFLNNLPKFIIKIIQSGFDFLPSIGKKCNRCLICINSCPTGAISMHNNKLKVHKDKCIKCLCCHEFCPQHAIELKKGWLIKFFSAFSKK